MRTVLTLVTNEYIMNFIHVNSKIDTLQRQVAMMSLTIASMQVHMKQLGESIEALKSVHGEEMASASPCLSVDDSDSDGYESDDSLAPRSKVESKSKIPTVAKSNDYVLVDVDGNDSGSEDDEDDDAKKMLLEEL